DRRKIPERQAPVARVPAAALVADGDVTERLLGRFADHSGENAGIEIEAQRQPALHLLLVPADDARVLRRPAPPSARVEAEDLAGRDLEALDAIELLRRLLRVGRHGDAARELLERLEDLVVAEYLSPRPGERIAELEAVDDRYRRIGRQIDGVIVCVGEARV